MTRQQLAHQLGAIVHVDLVVNPARVFIRGVLADSQSRGDLLKGESECHQHAHFGAFRDAELCADALDASFSGARTFEDAMGDYQRTRDADVLPIFELTCQFVTLEPPPPEMQQLLGAIHGNRKAMDGFVQANAGTISPAEFFAPASAAAILAAAT